MPSFCLCHRCAKTSPSSLHGRIRSIARSTIIRGCSPPTLQDEKAFPFQSHKKTNILPITPTTTTTAPHMPPAFPTAFAAPPKNGLGDGDACITPPLPVVTLVELVTFAVVVMFAPTKAGAMYEPFKPPPMPPTGLQSFCVNAVTTVRGKRKMSVLHA